MRFSLSTAKLLSTGALSLLAVLGATNPAQAFDLYFGEDLNFNGTGNTRDRLTETPNASAAESAFLSRFDTIGTETFEDFALGTEDPLALNFEGAATATLSGSGEISDWVQYGVHPISGEQYWLTRAGQNDNFTVSFDQAVAAFGFYATDIGDVGAKVNLEVGLANGETRIIDLAHNETRGQSGSVLYQGILAESEDELFTSVRFVTTNGRGDGFGFDNMTVGTFEQLQSVPEPASLLGLAAIAGAAALKRKRDQSA